MYHLLLHLTIDMLLDNDLHILIFGLMFDSLIDKRILIEIGYHLLYHLCNSLLRLIGGSFFLKIRSHIKNLCYNKLEEIPYFWPIPSITVLFECLNLLVHRSSFLGLYLSQGFPCCLYRELQGYLKL